MVERWVGTSIDMTRPFKSRLTAVTFKLDSLIKILTPFCTFAVFFVEIKIAMPGAHSCAHCASFSDLLCVSCTKVILKSNLRNKFSSAVRLVVSAIPAQLKVAILKAATVIVV